MSSGNQLHYLVIDYQSLDLLETLCFEAKAWSWINLEAMLNLWMFVEVILKATLFDYSLASSKPCIHTFTFSLFFMMTIIIKWILFDIIKTCMIHTSFYSAWIHKPTTSHLAKWNNQEVLQDCGVEVLQPAWLHFWTRPNLVQKF